jgi:FtsP/CotA-like multicopper oxidase with cupredoxin domain
MPAHYQTEQKKLVMAIDTENEKQAVKANTVPPEKMWPTDQHQIDSGVWPQYLAGAFPNYFEIPKYTPGDVHALTVPGATHPVMGQSPGTHWYHAHKHGSTALHILSGLAGAFIIEDNSPTGYDGALKGFYGKNFVQNVLVVQMFNPQQNLERGATVAIRQLVNGQLTPTISMNQNEVQLWRIINATVGGNQGTIKPAVFKSLTDAGFHIKQIAQDGVQFRWENFEDQPFLKAKDGVPGGLTIAAGNRVDLLVIAPAAATATPVATGTFFVNVTSTSVPALGFIDKAHYPVFPEFLENLAAPKTAPHPVRFGWSEGTLAGGRDAAGAPPHFLIDGKQFEQNGPIIDQCMELGSTQDWLLENYTTVPHPFHIHINPFQVREIYVPPAKADGTPTVYKPANPVWHDVINIPAGVIQTTGSPIVPGRVIIRHRFVDFVGTYVLHCHILAHEDRGMMQLVRVVLPEHYKMGCQTDIPMHH